MDQLSDQLERTRARLVASFPDAGLAFTVFRGELTVTVPTGVLLDVCRFLRAEEELDYGFLVDITAVDYPQRGDRFCLVYHLLSMQRRARLSLKTYVPEDEPVPSLTELWPGANFYEREVYDLFGVHFSGHPDLRRIMMPEDWEGHPLRKDYPLTTEPVPFSHDWEERGRPTPY